MVARDEGGVGEGVDVGDVGVRHVFDHTLRGGLGDGKARQGRGGGTSRGAGQQVASEHSDVLRSVKLAGA